tara:strand:- start:331 stop:933 length:603 start_codon:yes stop_codon:yes gene_type:complete
MDQIQQTNMDKSSSISSIVKGMIKAKSSIGNIIKESGFNPHLKNNYVELDHLLSVVNPALLDNKMFLFQLPTGTELINRLEHENGEFLQWSYQLSPVGADSQKVGSAITYARKYSIFGLLSLFGGADDDGSTASEKSSGGDSKASHGQDKKTLLSQTKFALGKKESLEEITKYFNELSENYRTDLDVIKLFTERKLEIGG